MDNRGSSGSRFIGALICFGLTAATAIVLLITSLIVWLSTLMGSVIGSLLIVGIFFALIAIVIYRLAVRDTLERIRQQFETIFEVAHTAQMGYEWLTRKVLLLFQVFGK